MEQGLRKGPWSKQEDEILKEYVKIYGPKKWNALQRLTGLPREGKSCRLRWLNHLNPNLRKAKISEEEKQKILQLRQLDGKWCEIVKQFPGKTDNEIKNFCNINERKKRKMENGNGECRKKKRNYLSLNDEIMKLHDNELKDNGENSLSGFISNEQKDISDTHERELMKDSFHIPIMQPSNMLCNNVASTSISNNSSPTFIDR
ncbi:MYB transcription factor EOBI [Trifolium repens]|nr:MYB transcription factor EOBI [Trifolium repens]